MCLEHYALLSVPDMIILMQIKMNLEYYFIVNERMTYFILFFKDFIYLFLERGEGREKERERNINVWLPLARPLLGTWPATQECALTGN